MLISLVYLREREWVKRIRRNSNLFLSSSPEQLPTVSPYLFRKSSRQPSSLLSGYLVWKRDSSHPRERERVSEGKKERVLTDIFLVPQQGSFSSPLFHWGLEILFARAAIFVCINLNLACWREKQLPTISSHLFWGVLGSLPLCSLARAPCSAPVKVKAVVTGVHAQWSVSVVTCVI